MGHAAHVLLVTGGTRSGKSRFAVDRARRCGPRVAYLATCRPADAEMRRRVARHRRERPSSWTTLEHPDDLVVALRGLPRRCDAVVIDCLTLYLAQRLVRGDTDAATSQHLRQLCRALRAVAPPVIIVTNEVGSGIVPVAALGRRFRDVAGRANQEVARAADEVVLMVAGLPLWVKGARR